MFGGGERSGGRPRFFGRTSEAVVTSGSIGWLLVTVALLLLEVAAAKSDFGLRPLFLGPSPESTELRRLSELSELLTELESGFLIQRSRGAFASSFDDSATEIVSQMLSFGPTEG